MYLDIFCNETCRYQKSGVCTLESVGVASSLNPKNRDCLYYRPPAKKTHSDASKDAEKPEFEAFF